MRDHEVAERMCGLSRFQDFLGIAGVSSIVSKRSHHSKHQRFRDETAHLQLQWIVVAPLLE